MEKLYPWRIGAILEVINACFSNAENIDVTLKSFFSDNKKLGKKDRVFIQTVCFDIVRHLASYTGSTINKKLEAYFVKQGFTNNDAKNALERFETIKFTLQDIEETYSFPLWLYNTIKEEWPNDFKSILNALNSSKQAYIRLNTVECNVVQIISLFEAANVSIEAVNNVSNASYIIDPLSINALNKTELYSKGYFEYQDLASQQLLFSCASKIELVPNANILDMCAGEGGKTVQLAQLYPKANLFVYDVLKRKLKRLDKRFQRLTKSKMPYILNDDEINDQNEKFDMILIDAPCSGTGTFGRLPVQKYFLKPADIKKYDDTQKELIEKASKKLKSRGYLIYSTCSILNRENSAQVYGFLERNASFVLVHKQQILPTQSHDGLFVALMQKIT